MGCPEDKTFANKFPSQEDLPGFADMMEQTYYLFEKIATWFLEALELAFDLPPGELTNKCSHGNNASELRFNHYPQIRTTELLNGTIGRIWPHFDLGVITLLFQDRTGGLEFEDRSHSETFQPVICDSEDELIVNVSETLQRWCNDELKAGLHRVNVPRASKRTTDEILPERYSIAYFCKADRRVSVGSLPQFVRSGCQPLYEDLTALEYHQKRLASAY